MPSSPEKQRWQCALSAHFEQEYAAHPLPKREDLNLAQEWQYRLLGGAIYNWLQRHARPLLKERDRLCESLRLEADPVIVIISDIPGLVAIRELLPEKPEALFYFSPEAFERFLMSHPDEGFRWHIDYACVFTESRFEYAMRIHPLRDSEQHWPYWERTMLGPQFGRSEGCLWKWDGEKPELLCRCCFADDFEKSRDLRQPAFAPEPLFPALVASRDEFPGVYSGPPLYDRKLNEIDDALWRLDPAFQEMARERGYAVTRGVEGHFNIPRRGLRRRDDRIYRGVDLVLALPILDRIERGFYPEMPCAISINAQTYGLSVSERRYYHRKLVEAEPFFELERSLRGLLARATDLLDSFDEAFINQNGEPFPVPKQGRSEDQKGDGN